MKIGLTIPFHRYPPYERQNYLILFEFFKKKFELWKKEIDTIYIIDSQGYFDGMNPEAILADFTSPEIRVIKTMNKSHADNLNYVVPMMSEDVIGILDMDTVIYEPNIIKRVMEDIQKVDVISMIERPSPDKVFRFAPYFFFARRESLLKVGLLDFNPEPPTHLDPLAKLTHKLLETGITYMEAVDDRTSIYLSKDDKILRSNKIEEPSGYYHIRNFNGGIHIVDTWLENEGKAKYHLDLMPVEEITRIFAWNWSVNSATLKREEIYQTILKALNFKNVTESRFGDLLQKFKETHPYVQ